MTNQSPPHTEGDPIPLDVMLFIARRFSGPERDEALALLETASLHDGSVPEPRLLRCVVVASGGSIQRLRMELETLKHDYRDVIVEGEYVPMGSAMVRVRNLDEPIPDEV